MAIANNHWQTIQVDSAAVHAYLVLAASLSNISGGKK